MADLIDEQMALLRATLPEQPKSFWQTLERRMRDAWGGERHYVGRRPAEGKALRLGATLAHGGSLADAFDQAGVNRRWGFRLLLRKA